MNTVLHIFKKDLWHTRGPLALWLALLWVQFDSSLAARQVKVAEYDILLAAGPQLTVWTLLHWLGLMTLTFNVLLADRAFGTEPQWKTRPIARGKMAAAKFGFLGLFLVVLPVAVELASQLAQGVPVRQVAAAAWMPLLGQAYVVSWMALVALFCRRRGWEVAVLAVLALAAPVGVFVLLNALHYSLRRLPSVALAFESNWDSAPDYLAYPEAYHLRLLAVLALLPVVVLTALGTQAYLFQQRSRTLRWFAVLLVTWELAPFALMLEGIANSKSRRAAPMHLFTAPELGVSHSWEQRPYGWRPFTLLVASFRQPELPSTSGPLKIVEAHWGHTRLHLTRKPATAADARGYEPHFTLPDSNPTRFADHVRMPAQDVFVNRALTRTNGLLGTWLGPHTVLNPVTPDNEPKVTLKWEADRPLTNFTHATVELRVVVVESECRLVGRLPFAEFRAQHPTTNAEPTDAVATDPRYSVTTVSRTAGWPNPMELFEGEWAATAPRKAVLWHPKRREILLPATSNTYKNGNHGVLALAELNSLQVHTHTSQFPHTQRGKEPQPGAPGPEWFAEAEVLLLSFQPITNLHRIIQVPDVPLPPVEGKP